MKETEDVIDPIKYLIKQSLLEMFENKEIWIDLETWSGPEGKFGLCIHLRDKEGKRIISSLHKIIELNTIVADNDNLRSLETHNFFGIIQ